jgi:hypothetical protein
MARYNWVFKNATTATNFTSSVLSASYRTGRQTYMDNWSGGSLVFTIKNDANQAAGFTVNDKIDLIDGIFVADYQRFFVNEIQYVDYPGQVGLSTATITCTDALHRSGQNTINNLTLFAEQCCEQLEQFPASGQIAGSGYTIDGTTYGIGASKALGLGGGYNGSVLQRINQNMATERGIIWYNEATIYAVARDEIYDKTMGLTFGRTPSSTVIAYQEFQRITLGQNFMNAVSIEPLNNTSYNTFSTNATSTAAYGVRGYSLSTVDFTAAQGKGLGQFLANSQSDPQAVRFVVGFDDVAQNTTAINTFVGRWLGGFNAPVVVMPLEYKIQGSATTYTEQCVIEGLEINMTPEKTSFTAYLSPAVYYQFFILNNATFGVLNTSRLGW